MRKNCFRNAEKSASQAYLVEVQQNGEKVTKCIQKSIGEVFEAIVDPDKMSNYFISKGNGRMEAGKELTWYFLNFPRRCR